MDDSKVRDVDDMVQHLRGARMPPAFDIKDVMLFVDNDMAGIRERFDKMPFLPWTMPDVESQLLFKEAHDDSLRDVTLEKRRYLNSEEFRGQWGFEQNRLNSYKTAAYLMRLTFRLLETLQDPERPITYETLAEFDGTVCCDLNHKRFNGPRSQYVEGIFQFHIPSCDYLIFLDEGCEKLRREPLYCECLLDPYGDDSEEDPYIGWLASKHGAILTHYVYWYDDENAPRVFLESLLRFMFDVHFHDIQMLVNGRGEFNFYTGYALPLVWVAMRKALGEDGRAGVCPVCGRHFIATGERGYRRLYCGRTSCKKAYQRVRSALKRMNEGESPEEAARRTPSISLARIVDIALRNRAALEREYPNVVFDELARRR